ncbi:LamG-like jellyroll fold domain-containing protein [Aestuariivivens marinum]|uniref:LamG-like jellyroll fold domain-containing protein n=1 Tax=Aestuariivivens marinum TaxID=2913555 RepID=UPI001F5945B3|nr:LamG-like jellyroll fold domain-containing protein [Aestuariivivens marinum]
MNHIKIKSLIPLLLLALVFACSPNDNGLRKDEGSVNSSLLPTVDFTASSTTIFQGESVTFSNTTAGEGLLYLWSFEEGNPSESHEANPEVTYFTTGAFAVTLKVRNEYGAQEIVREGYIVVEKVPIQKQPQHPAVTVRLNFEENLGNEGSVDTDAETTGAIAFEAGIVNGFAFTFDGSNALTIPAYNGVNGSNPRAVTAWVKTTSTTRETITHWGAQATGSRASFVMNGNGTIRFEVAGGGINGVTAVNDGQWHHVAHVFDGVDTVRMYVDGVQDAIWTTGIINTGVGGETVVEIGSQLGGNVFDGSMDDVRIYDVALSDGDIESIANADKLAVKLNFESGLFNEGDKGEDVISAGTQAFGTGRVNGQSYTFDGGNALTVNQYKGVNGSNPRTVTAWVKTSSTTRETITHWGAQGIGSRASFVMNGNGTIRFEVAGGGINGATAVNDGQWHHVAHVFDGVDTVKMYVDGVEDASWTTGIINTGVAGETDLEIGSQLGGNIFDGSMDDVRVYESALSAAAINALSQQF